MSIKLSTIIPIYNKEKTLSYTLQSVVDNHEIDDNVYECILVDNESTDSSPEICKDYCDKYPYFKYIRIFNDNDLSGAKNAGLKYCDGEYVHFLDTNSTLRKSFYKDAVKILDISKLDVFIRGYYTVNPIYDQWRTFIPQYFKNEMYGPPLNSCIFKNYIKDIEFQKVSCQDNVFTWIALNKKQYYDDTTNYNSVVINTDFIDSIEQENGLPFPKNIVSLLQTNDEYLFELDNSGTIVKKYNNNKQRIYNGGYTLNKHIISNNCLAGFIYRDLELRNQHPFIWSTLLHNDYVTLMDEYDKIDFNNFNVVPTMLQDQIKNGSFTVLIDNNKLKVSYVHYHQDNECKEIVSQGNDLYYNKMQSYVDELYKRRVNRMLENGLKQPIFLLVKNNYYSIDEFYDIAYKPTKYKKIVLLPYDYQIQLDKVPRNTYIVHIPSGIDDWNLLIKISNILVKDYPDLLELN